MLLTLLSYGTGNIFHHLRNVLDRYGDRFSFNCTVSFAFVLEDVITNSSKSSTLSK